MSTPEIITLLPEPAAFRSADVAWYDGGDDRAAGSAPSETAAYRLGDLLLSLLVGWGLFGQTTLVLLATWLDVESRALTMPARGLTLVLAAGVFLALLLRPSRANLGWPLVLFVAFWFIYGGRLALEASEPVTTLADYRSPLYIAAMAAGACFLPGLAALACTCWSGHRRARNLTVLLITLSGVAMLSMYREHIAYFAGRSALGENTEAAAMHPLSLGYTGVLLIALAIYLLGCAPLGLYRRLVLTGGLGVVGIALVVGSASRGPMFSLAAALLALAASHARRRKPGRVALLTAAMVAVTIAIVAYTQSTGSSLLDRLMGVPTDMADDAGTTPRVVLYGDAFEAFAASPLIGSRSTLDEAAYPHNLILEALMATGLLGTVPLLLLLWLGLRGAWQILLARPDLAWLPLIFIIFLVGGMFSWSIFTNTSLWLSLGATLSCAAWIRSSPAAAMPEGALRTAD